MQLDFLDILRHKEVMVQMGNTITMYYPNKPGGTGLWRLCKEAIAVWRVATKNQVSLRAIHIAGALNSTANRLNRTYLSKYKSSIQTEVYLQETFKRIIEMEGSSRVIQSNPLRSGGNSELLHSHTPSDPCFHAQKMAK